MDFITTDDPEEAGWSHTQLDFSQFKLNDLVEIITKHGLCIVGIIVCNKYNIVRIADPCKAVIQPIQIEKNKLQYITSLFPWRTMGDDNYAQFNFNDISNISKVTSPEYWHLWANNMKEFAKIWYESGGKAEQDKNQTGVLK